jgi:hypothetical protein
MVDNVRFAQAAVTLVQAQGKCGTPETLNIALDGVAALAPSDGMEVMPCSQLVAFIARAWSFCGGECYPTRRAKEWIAASTAPRDC